jgi:hypothetical protein
MVISYKLLLLADYVKKHFVHLIDKDSNLLTQQQKE